MVKEGRGRRGGVLGEHQKNLTFIISEGGEWKQASSTLNNQEVQANNNHNNNNDDQVKRRMCVSLCENVNVSVQPSLFLRTTSPMALTHAPTETFRKSLSLFFFLPSSTNPAKHRRPCARVFVRERERDCVIWELRRVEAVVFFSSSLFFCRARAQGAREPPWRAVTGDKRGVGVGVGGGWMVVGGGGGCMCAPLDGSLVTLMAQGSLMETIGVKRTLEIVNIRRPITVLIRGRGKK